MAKDIWFISDTHINHANILTFLKDDQTPVRPGFKDVDEMNERIIDNWNRTIKPGDKVYHCGDVIFGPKQDWPKYLSRLQGDLRLIYGNHDHVDPKHYLPYFKKIMSWRQFRDMPIPFICCHYPLHPDSLYGRGGIIFNVHGHIHERVVRTDTGHRDQRYFNICVEHHDYTPIHMDALQAELKRRQHML